MKSVEVECSKSHRNPIKEGQKKQDKGRQFNIKRRSNIEHCVHEKDDLELDSHKGIQ